LEKLIKNKMKIEIEIECECINDLHAHLMDISHKAAVQAYILGLDSFEDEFKGEDVLDALDDSNCNGHHLVTIHND
jgi:hypothetical protein